MSEAQKEKYVALSYRDFRLFWFGQGISNIGTWMQTAAIGWQIYELTHSKLALAMIGLSKFVPIVLFSLIGGATADAKNRKKVLYVTQTLLFVISGFLAVLTYLHAITPALIYLLTIAATIVLTADGPARQALVPGLVKKEHLPNAMSLNFIMFQTAMITGQGLSGIVIAKFGTGAVYLINALSYISVLVALFMMKTDGAIEGDPGQISFAAMREGLSFVRHKTIIWSTMLLDFFSTFFASATVLLPVFATDVLHVGPVGFGVLSAANSAGAVLMGVLLANKGKLKYEGKLLLMGVTSYAVGTIIFGFSTSFLLSCLALMVVGAGDSLSTIIRNTIRNVVTPDYIRGRMTSVNMIFFMGGPQLGEFEAGALAAAVGGPWSVVLGGIGTLVAVGAVAWGIPTLRKYEGSK